MIKLARIEFHLYGLLIGLGVWMAWETSLWMARVRKVDRQLIDRAMEWILIPAMVGARLLYVLFRWDYYQNNRVDIFKIWQGGMRIWGAIGGGLLGLYLYWRMKAKRRIGFGELADLVVVGVPLGQAVGRWGNFFNKELWGIPTKLPWGWLVEGVKVHPLFLYESVLNLLVWLVLVVLIKKQPEWLRSGSLVGVYLIGYGVVRFVLEPLRPEELIWKIGTFSVVWVFCLGAGLMGGWLVWGKRDK